MHAPMNRIGDDVAVGHRDGSTADGVHTVHVVRDDHDRYAALTQAGEDARNYGGQQGIAEVRALFTHLLDAPADQIVVATVRAA